MRVGGIVWAVTSPPTSGNVGCLVARSLIIFTAEDCYRPWRALIFSLLRLVQKPRIRMMFVRYYCSFLLAVGIEISAREPCQWRLRVSALGDRFCNWNDTLKWILPPSYFSLLRFVRVGVGARDDVIGRGTAVRWEGRTTQELEYWKALYLDNATRPSCAARFMNRYLQTRRVFCLSWYHRNTRLQKLINYVAFFFLPPRLRLFSPRHTRRQREL